MKSCRKLTVGTVDKLLFSKRCETPVSSKVICVLPIFIRKLTSSVSDEAGKVIDYHLCI